MDAVELRPFARRYAAPLAAILREDALLHRALAGDGACPPCDADAVYAQGRNWEERRQGKIYVIFCNGAPSGSISFHLQRERAVFVGYWLRSALWGRGMMTRAFAQLLERLAAAGYESASAHIERGNTASLRLWYRYGAEETTRGGQCYVTLCLKDGLPLAAREKTCEISGFDEGD